MTELQAPVDIEKLRKLRTTITENLRVQRGGAEFIPYIDIGNVLGDVSARQNHVVFGRRGCGKTLLLHHSTTRLPATTKAIYLNCEDFKKHSYPNVLIEILDALFQELERHLGGWFGRKKRSKDLIVDIRRQLAELRKKADARHAEVKETASTASGSSVGTGASAPVGPAKLEITGDLFEHARQSTERTYIENQDKIGELNTWLPRLKSEIREFFELSSTVKAIYLQIDDFYHLGRPDQPLVIDFIHRLCKDLPIYFKVATLRHASTLYVERKEQPIGAQERHDYQPINIDFTFSDYRRTIEQNRKIFYEFARLAGMTPTELDQLFKGEGFGRLILAGGGVPRDCLSLFLEVLENVQPPGGDGKIGKDEVRTLSRGVFERRIEELKQDSDGEDQGILLRGIYVLRQFCVIERRTNIFLVSEAVLQQDPNIRRLLHRLLDYRIIHSAGSALTHKSQPGTTYHAFAVDMGCYAHMRVLDRKFTEIDLGNIDAKEQMRSAPVLDKKAFADLWASAPADPETALRTQESSAA